MEPDKTSKPYGLGLIAWSIQWGIVLSIPVACVIYLIQFFIQGHLTWTPLYATGAVASIAIFLFLAKQITSGDFSKKQE